MKKITALVMMMALLVCCGIAMAADSGTGDAFVLQHVATSGEFPDEMHSLCLGNDTSTYIVEFTHEVAKKLLKRKGLLQLISLGLDGPLPGNSIEEVAQGLFMPGEAYEIKPTVTIVGEPIVLPGAPCEAPRQKVDSAEIMKMLSQMRPKATTILDGDPDKVFSNGTTWSLESVELVHTGKTISMLGRIIAKMPDRKWVSLTFKTADGQIFKAGIKHETYEKMTTCLFVGREVKARSLPEALESGLGVREYKVIEPENATTRKTPVVAQGCTPMTEAEMRDTRGPTAEEATKIDAERQETLRRISEPAVLRH